MLDATCHVTRFSPMTFKLQSENLQQRRINGPGRPRLLPTPLNLQREMPDSNSCCPTDLPGTFITSDDGTWTSDIGHWIVCRGHAIRTLSLEAPRDISADDSDEVLLDGVDLDALLEFHEELIERVWPGQFETFLHDRLIQTTTPFPNHDSSSGRNGDFKQLSAGGIADVAVAVQQIFRLDRFK